MADRTVHASYSGMEIVRYDRAGKWYLEPTDPTLQRRQVSIDQAVAAARLASEGNVFLGRPGGTAFDKKVRG
jgi:hypothetical protein